jgi:ADP-ribose pyrophosphatase YjhB (NUDIX family)
MTPDRNPGAPDCGDGAPPARHSVLVQRQAVRVLLCDVDRRVLMLRGHDPAEPSVRYWFTVGGGLEPGEDVVAAAIRETAEETGLDLLPHQVLTTGHRDVAEFGFDQYWFVQHQHYVWAVAPPGFEAAPRHLEPAEAATVDAFGWWSVPQLLANRDGRPHDGPGRPGEATYPPDLPELVQRWLPGGVGGLAGRLPC